MARNKDQDRKTVGFWLLVQSVLAAGLGVQSHRRYEEDFTSSSPFPYIVGGVIFTPAFMGVLLFIAWLALP